MDASSSKDYRASGALKPSNIGRPSIFKVSSLQSLNPRPSDMMTRNYNFASNSRLDLGYANNGPSNIIQSTPLLQKFHEAADNQTTFSMPNSQGTVQSSLSANRNDVLSSVPRSNQGTDRSSAIRSTSSIAFQLNAPVVHLTKDPRDTTLKEWQDAAMEKLFNFLTHRGFTWNRPKQFSVDDINPPSLKTLTTVFEFLIGILLNTTFTVKDGKLPEEVKRFATDLGYPFANILTKNLLMSPNTRTSWPVVCGFLDWLCEEVMLWSELSSGDFESLSYKVFFENQNGLEDIEKMFHELRLKFMVQAYRRIRNGDNDVDDLLEMFRNELLCVFGDTKQQIDAVTAELEEKGTRFKAKLDNYESLERVVEKKHAIEEAIKICQQQTIECKRAKTDIEKRMQKSQTDLQRDVELEKKKKEELKSLKEQIDQQPVKSHEYKDLQEEKRNVCNQIESLVKEIQTMKESMGLSKREKTGVLKKLQIMASELRSAMADMVEVDNAIIADYVESEDVNDYVNVVKNEMDRVIDIIRKKYEETTIAGEKESVEFSQRDKEIAQLKTEAEKLLEEEKKLNEKLSERQVAEPDKDVTRLQGDKNRLIADCELRKKEAEDLEKQLASRKLKRKHKEKQFKTIQKHIRMHEAVHIRMEEQLKKKHEERQKRLTELPTSVERKVFELKQHETSTILKLVQITKNKGAESSRSEEND